MERREDRALLFSSLGFLFRFLPVFLLVYILVPQRLRTLVLFAGSLVFYALGEPLFVVFLLAQLLVNYGLYRLGLARGSRFPGGVAAVLDLGLLALLKYVPLPGLTMPVGISFFTFRFLSFLADRRGKEKVSFLNFATYITLFPMMLAGPIARYREVEKDLQTNRFTLEGLERGAREFAIGLGYKVLLANQIGTLWNSVLTAGTSGLGMGAAWLGAVAYTFRIYFDFWGYSKMAVGLGTMLGFDLPENFLQPYSARTFSDFWRRWHVTLGSFFRDYVYIPLGGSRKGTAVTIRNLFIVWALTGIWHGDSLNFLLWGLLFFALLTLEKFVYGRFLDRHRFLGHVYVILLLPLTWVVFAISDLPTLTGYLKAMFALGGGEILTGTAVLFRYLWTYGGLLAACLIFSTPYPARLREKYKDSFLVGILTFAVFAFSCYELAKGGSNPFLYFRF